MIGGTVGGERLRCGRVDAYDIISLYVPREADSDAGLAIVRSSQFSVLSSPCLRKRKVGEGGG